MYYTNLKQKPFVAVNYTFHVEHRNLISFQDVSLSEVQASSIPTWPHVPKTISHNLTIKLKYTAKINAR